MRSSMRSRPGPKHDRRFVALSHKEVGGSASTTDSSATSLKIATISSNLDYLEQILTSSRCDRSPRRPSAVILHKVKRAQRLVDPYRDLDVIDSRAPRFNQVVVGAVSALAVATGWWWLLALLALQLLAGLTFGRRYCLPCLLYFEVVQPHFGEGPLEDARPPRFANMVGAAFLTTASISYLAGAETLGAVLGALVALLALLAATTGFCAGCEAYKLGHLLTGRRFIACPLPPRPGSRPERA